MDYESIMRKHGATDRHLNSKTAEVLLEALAEEKGFLDESTKQAMVNLRNNVMELKNEQKKTEASIHMLMEEMNDSAKELSETVGEAKSLCGRIKSEMFTDALTQEAFNLYRNVLEVSVSILKEEDGLCTPELIGKAIEAASNGMCAYLRHADGGTGNAPEEGR